MKVRIKLLLSALLITPVFITGVAAAVENTTTTTTTASPPSSTTTTTRPTPEQIAAKRKEMATRLAQRKTELKTKLTALEQTKIKTKCTASQGILTSTQARVKGIETSRTKVHDNLVNRLTDLSAKLKEKGADTTALNSQITMLKSKIATFKTDMTSYQQTLDDLANMDCAIDPTAFKASLEAARTARKKVLADATDIRKYVVETIKPTLVIIRASLTTTEGGN